MEMLAGMFNQNNVALQVRSHTNESYMFNETSKVTFTLSVVLQQGSHSTWKTWKTWKNESTPGKPGNIMEF